MEMRRGQVRSLKRAPMRSLRHAQLQARGTRPTPLQTPALAFATTGTRPSSSRRDGRGGTQCSTGGRGRARNGWPHAHAHAARRPKRERARAPPGAPGPHSSPATARQNGFTPRSTTTLLYIALCGVRASGLSDCVSRSKEELVSAHAGAGRRSFRGQEGRAGEPVRRIGGPLVRTRCPTRECIETMLVATSTLA